MINNTLAEKSIVESINSVHYISFVKAPNVFLPITKSNVDASRQDLVIIHRL